MSELLARAPIGGAADSRDQTTEFFERASCVPATCWIEHTNWRVGFSPDPQGAHVSASP